MVCFFSSLASSESILEAYAEWPYNMNEEEMKDHFSEVRMMHCGSRGHSHEHSLKASGLLHTEIMTFLDTMIKNVCPGLTLECNFTRMCYSTVFSFLT